MPHDSHTVLFNENLPPAFVGNLLIAGQVRAASVPSEYLARIKRCWGVDDYDLRDFENLVGVLSRRGVGPIVRFSYLNHRGERADRSVMLTGMRHGTSEYYPTPCWLMCGFDLHRQEAREFEITKMEPIGLAADEPKRVLNPCETDIGYVPISPPSVPEDAHRGFYCVGWRDHAAGLPRNAFTGSARRGWDDREAAVKAAAAFPTPLDEPPTIPDDVDAVFYREGWRGHAEGQPCDPIFASTRLGWQAREKLVGPKRRAST